MSTAALSNSALGLDSWGFAEAADRRFRKTVAVSLLVVVTFAVIIPWLQLQMEPVEEKPPVTQVIELLPDPPRPKPVVKVETPPETKPVEKALVKPRPQEDAPKSVQPKKDAPAPAAAAAPAPSAREIAQRSGLMRFSNQLAAMPSPDLLTASTQQPLQLESGITATTTTTTSGARLAAVGNSGGIGGHGQSVTGIADGTSLGTRRTASVQSGIGYGHGAPAGNGGGNGPGLASSRTLQEIQLAFDRNKSAFFAIFNRAARENAEMGAGKVVMSLTIAPDGSVTRCEIVSSSFGDPDLQEKIVQRVKLMNFGAKNVPSFTYPNYPMNFLPSGAGA